MRLIFAGSPEAAVPSLERLAGDHEVVAVLTRQDAPQGRKRVLTPSAVAVSADALGLPVVKANRIGQDVVDRLAVLRADLGVIVAYGAILREPLLSVPVLGWINLHFSLLPRWRGAAPVQRAIISGDAITGVSVFQLVDELDAGPLWARQEHRVAPHQTAGEMLSVLAEEGSAVLAGVVDARGRSLADEPALQDGEPTFAPKLGIEDGLLRFGQPAQSVYDRFRGVTPEPGAYGLLDGERLKVLEMEPLLGAPPLAPGELRADRGGVIAGTGTHPIRLVLVQPQGRRAMPAGDWWRGVRDQERIRLDA